MRQALIGLTCEKENNKLIVSNDILSCLANLGATGAPIPYDLKREEFLHFLENCDGFIFCGGGDIHPKFYGGEPPADLKNICFKRDTFEKNVFDYVLPSGKPILGICRGMQVINVFLGGHLQADIAGHFQDYPRDFCSHKVKLNPNGNLVKIVDNISFPFTIQVNSFHHQCVDILAPELTVEAVSDDEIIEAFSLKDHDFLLGIQWHPECTFGADVPSLAIFEAFVSACKKRS